MAVVIGALRAELSASIARFAEDMGKAADSVSKFSDRFAKLGKSMRNVGSNFSTYVTAPIVGFGGAALKVAGDFELAMNNVAAVSGATGDQLERLRQLARDMGETTQFTASQAADALGFLAMAGFRAEEAMAALPGTLQLASSAQMDLGRAADIVSNILSGYGFEVDQLARVNDVIVKSFTSANTNLEQLGEAMKYAGPIASAAGVRFEEAAAALSMMGNAGIQASMAGTSLRGAIARILNPTRGVASAMKEIGLQVQEADGSLRPLVDILRQLEPHAANAGLFMELFGQRAGPAMAALVSQGADALTELTTQLDSAAGTAERISAVQMEGFVGQMRALKSAGEGLAIALAESGLLSAMTEAVREVASWVRALAELNPEILKWTTIVLGVAAALGPLIYAIGAIVTVIGAVAPAVAMAGAAFSSLAGVVTAVKTGIGLLVLAWPTLGTVAMSVVPAIAAFASQLAFAGKVILAMITGAAAPLVLIAAAVAAAVAVWYYWDEIVPIVKALYEGVRKWLQEKLGAVLDWVGEKVDAVTGFFANMYDAVVGNSWVPDMVDGIAREFARLPDIMVKPAADATADTGDAFETLGQRAAQTFRKMFEDGKFSIDGLMDMMRQLADEMFVNPFFDAVGGAAQSAIGSGVSSLGNLFSGFFAKGGTIPAGHWGIAGEQGAEIVYGGSHGVEVIPAGAGGGMNVTFNISTPDAQSFRKSESQISAMLARAVSRGQRNF